jgi:hypothetical protein
MNTRHSFRELDFRVFRVQKEILYALKRIELAILCKEPREFYEGQLELANARRKLDWFSKALQSTLSNL